MNILSAAGIDINTFTSHSNSKAKAQCVSTKRILKRGFGSNNSAFEKFYHKKIYISKDSEFQSGFFEGFEERQ